jgi:flagellar protein FliO/FliZ
MAILLLFGAGLFIQIPTIAAQETPSEEIVEEDPYRLAEQAYSLDDTAAAAVSASGPSVWAVVRMLLILAVVAAAIYGVVYFLRKTAKPTAASDPYLKVLSNKHLGSNRYVHIISVGDKVWLVGSSEGGVNLISEIENKEIKDAMLLEDSKKSAQAAPGKLPDFLSLLRRMGAKAQPQVLDADEIRRRRERLKEI